MTNLFNTDDAYHNGAFMLAANFGFYNLLPAAEQSRNAGTPRRQRRRQQVPDAYQFFLNAGTLWPI